MGERGTRLSGGERQRIGIARALYLDTPVLILDEATSSLDVENQELIIQVLNKLKRIKTIIMITHRLETTTNCNQLIELRNGKVYNKLNA